MNNEQIKTFLKIAETSSFSKTANELYTSQPSVSKRIAALEKEVGCQLFDRLMGQTVRLTPQGELYKEAFLAMQQILERTEKECRRLEEKNTYVINIGCGSNWDVQEVYYEMKKNFAECGIAVTINLQFGSSVRLEQKLKKGELDYILIWEDSLIREGEIKNVKTAHLCTMDYLLIYSEKHPLARKKDLHIQDFASFDSLVLQDVFQKNQKNFKQDIYQLGFSSKFWCAPDYDSLLMRLRAGDGYSIQDELTLSRYMGELKFLRLDKKTDWCLVWIRDFDPFIEERLIAILQKSLQKMLQDIREQ